jgi:arsenate reductase
MLTIYGIKNCDTMKKAFTELEAMGTEYVFHDYKKTGIDARTLQAWVKAKGLETVLNKRGTSWRKLSPAEQAEAGTEAGAIALMQANTSLIKRPVLQGEGILLVGFSAEEYRKALG